MTILTNPVFYRKRNITAKSCLTETDQEVRFWLLCAPFEGCGYTYTSTLSLRSGTTKCARNTLELAQECWLGILYFAGHIGIFLIGNQS